jgi:hypothetical protein
MNNNTIPGKLLTDIKSKTMNLIDLDMDPEKLEHMKAPLSIHGFTIDDEDSTFPKPLINITLTNIQSNILLEHMANIWNRSTFEHDIYLELSLNGNSRQEVATKVPLYTFRRRIKGSEYKHSMDKEYLSTLAFLNDLEIIMATWKAQGVDYLVISGLFSKNCNEFEPHDD